MDNYLLHMGKTQMLQAWNSVDFNQYEGILGTVLFGKINQFYSELQKVDIDIVNI